MPELPRIDRQWVIDHVKIQHNGVCSTNSGSERAEAFADLRESILGQAVANNVIYDGADADIDDFTVSSSGEATYTHPTEGIQIRVRLKELEGDAKTSFDNYYEVSNAKVWMHDEEKVSTSTGRSVRGEIALDRKTDSLKKLPNDWETSFKEVGQSLAQWPSVSSRKLVSDRFLFVKHFHSQVKAKITSLLDAKKEELKQARVVRAANAIQKEIARLNQLSAQLEGLDIYALSKALSLCPKQFTTAKNLVETAEAIEKSVIEDIQQANKRSLPIPRRKGFKFHKKYQPTEADREYAKDVAGLIYTFGGYSKYCKRQGIESKRENLADVFLHAAIAFTKDPDGDYTGREFKNSSFVFKEETEIKQVFHETGRLVSHTIKDPLFDKVDKPENYQRTTLENLYEATPLPPEADTDAENYTEVNNGRARIYQENVTKLQVDFDKHQEQMTKRMELVEQNLDDEFFDAEEGEIQPSPIQERQLATAAPHGQMLRQALARGGQVLARGAAGVGMAMTAQTAFEMLPDAVRAPILPLVAAPGRAVAGVVIGSQAIQRITSSIVQRGDDGTRSVNWRNLGLTLTGGAAAVYTVYEAVLDGVDNGNAAEIVGKLGLSLLERGAQMVDGAWGMHLVPMLGIAASSQAVKSVGNLVPRAKPLTDFVGDTGEETLNKMREVRQAFYFGGWLRSLFTPTYGTQVATIGLRDRAVQAFNNTGRKRGPVLGERLLALPTGASQALVRVGKTGSRKLLALPAGASQALAKVGEVVKKTPFVDSLSLGASYLWNWGWQLLWRQGQAEALRIDAPRRSVEVSDSEDEWDSVNFFDAEEGGEWPLDNQVTVEELDANGNTTRILERIPS